MSRSKRSARNLYQRAIKKTFNNHLTTHKNEHSI